MRAKKLHRGWRGSPEMSNTWGCCSPKENRRCWHHQIQKAGPLVWARSMEGGVVWWQLDQGHCPAAPLLLPVSPPLPPADSSPRGVGKGACRPEFPDGVDPGRDPSANRQGHNALKKISEMERFSLFALFWTRNKKDFQANTSLCASKGSWSLLKQ